MYNEEKTVQCKKITCATYSEFSTRSRCHAVFPIELIICLTSKVERVKVHIHVVRDVQKKDMLYYLHNYSLT